MNPFVAHMISGQVLFTALPMIVLFVLLREYNLNAGLRRLSTVLACLCCVIGVSTAAYPWWLLGTMLAMVGVWSIHNWLAVSDKTRYAILSAPIILASLMVAIESGWASRPSIPPIKERSVVILGDSLSAGLGEKEGTPWPAQLQEAYHIQVFNLSEAGATTADGLKVISQTDHYPGIVIVELGGNDLLSGGTLTDFERHLDGILSHLRQHNRSAVMIELPLLPGKNAWGVTQRQLSRKYHCPLIPKCMLVDVLAVPGATVDTLHLSQAGHHELADQMGKIIEPALPSW